MSALVIDIHNRQTGVTRHVHAIRGSDVSVGHVRMVTISSSALRFLSLLGHVLHRSQEGKNLADKNLTWLDFIFPYQLSLNSASKQLELQKRNWFGIGIDTKTFNFGEVRNVLVDEHLITASIEIRVYAGNLSAHWLTKKQANSFKDYLMGLKTSSDRAGIFLE